MLKRIKCIILIFAICATVVERLPGVSLTIGFIYILLSFFDNFIINRNIKYNSRYNQICYGWIILFVVLTIITVLMPTERSDLILINFKWVRVILLFILVYRDTIDNKILQKDILICYGLCSLVCAVLMNLGIGMELDQEAIKEGQVRVSFLGTNSNKMAMIFAYSIAIFILYLEIGWRYKLKKFYRIIISLIVISILLYSLAMTGSRGGFLAIVVVLIYYFVVFKHSKKLLYNLFIMIVGIAFFYLIFDKLSEIDVLANRFLDAKGGNIGARDILFNIGLDIFINNPIFGIGMNAVPEYINKEFGEYLTTHNLFIYILASGGIISFSIFGFIFYNITRNIYVRSFRNRRIFISIALFILVTADWMKNGSALTTVINYIMLSLAYSISDSKENIENKIV